MSKTKGLKPKDRKLATQTQGKKLTANQWQNTPQQNLFMMNWLDIDSPTFGNTYKSGLAAKYSDNYSKQLASIGLKWLTDYNKIAKWQVEHLEQKLISMVNGKITRDTSNSPDDTRIRAIELLAKITGKLDNRNTTTVNIVQPILAGASVKKVQTEVIDQ